MLHHLCELISRRADENLEKKERNSNPFPQDFRCPGRPKGNTTFRQSALTVTLELGDVAVDPVGVEDAEVGVLAADLLLGDGLEVALELEVVDTLVLGLTPDHTAVVLALAASAADGAADDDVALLGLVAEAVGLVGAGEAAELGDAVALAVLPGADAEEEAERVALLVPPQLFHVLVAAHLGLVGWWYG